MTKLRFLSMAIAITAMGIGLVACDDDNKDEPLEVRLWANKSTAVFTDQGGDVTIEVSSNVNWTTDLDNKTDFSIVETAEANTFIIRAEKNTAETEKKATVTIIAGTKTWPIAVTQEPVRKELEYADLIGTYKVNGTPIGYAEGEYPYEFTILMEGDTETNLSMADYPYYYPVNWSGIDDNWFILEQFREGYGMRSLVLPYTPGAGLYVAQSVGYIDGERYNLLPSADENGNTLAWICDFDDRAISFDFHGKYNGYDLLFGILVYSSTTNEVTGAIGDSYRDFVISYQGPLTRSTTYNPARGINITQPQLLDAATAAKINENLKDIPVSQLFRSVAN